ncbi:type III CRISPR-associated RAMP protein Csx7 [Paraliomyxa miuraensis]|uniref:type III CRISPR-associated RAMP protein Csx7 n=1 Tax=Paraliomyxa miuraensis TaxID=376150 RepID=UPI002253DB09|nr:CRISPR-associated RAMP protein Csx7 [Paraliomyxa miuraensis]MCX4242502.1 CRISPR-associated RAMP protein Csx7 [Paraliomyxa miuraensis]
MFKVSYNRAVLRFRLQTVTPLAIRAGETGLDPSAADLVCVRTHHVQHGLTVYIPGSSLKGVLRSTAEASLRAFEFPVAGGVFQGACNPTDHETSCRRHESKVTADVHRKNCLACRLFGSLSMRGRCAVRDLLPFPDGVELGAGDRENLERANRVEIRHGIAIDRISGAVKGAALFEQEVVPAGVRFHGEIVLQNYQAWQLGLVFSALDDLDRGFAQLGSSKSSGLGVVEVKPLSMVHEQAMGRDARPRGVGELVDDATGRAHGLLPERSLPPASAVTRGLSQRFEIAASEVARWRSVGQEALSTLKGIAREVRDGA